VRAFLAVPSDPAWAESVGRLAGRMKTSLPRASWTRSDAWHLTLKFLGEIAPVEAERLCEDLASITEGTGTMVLKKGGAVVFPPRGRPRVLGIGFSPSDGLAALESLAAAAEEVVRRAGLPPEERRFQPHLTLARLRDPWPVSAVDEFRRDVEAWELPPWEARSCVLYESRLAPSGAVHTPLRTFAFPGPRQTVGA
jgi:RNA 2',3'-cyclic 3'-phosphodiesterase